MNDKTIFNKLKEIREILSTAKERNTIAFVATNIDNKSLVTTLDDNEDEYILNILDAELATLDGKINSEDDDV